VKIVLFLFSGNRRSIEEENLVNQLASNNNTSNSNHFGNTIHANNLNPSQVPAQVAITEVFVELFFASIVCQLTPFGYIAKKYKRMAANYK
jgi:hypothetical protein